MRPEVTSAETRRHWRPALGRSDLAVVSRYANREEASSRKEQKEPELIRPQPMMKRYFYLVLTSWYFRVFFSSDEEITAEVMTAGK